MLARELPGVDLTLTTNGSTLKAKARALKAAGLTRITVSLDSLDDATFKAMNDADFPVAKVLEAIDVAAAEGLTPVKINMVVKRGVNDRHVVDMARYFKGSGTLCASSNYGCGRHQRLEDGRRHPQRGGGQAHPRGVSLRARRPRTTSVKLPDAGVIKMAGRVRRHLQRHRGLLRRLHPRAAFHRWRDLHLSVRAEGL